MDEVKKLLGSDQLIIGLKRTLKLLRVGKVKKIFLASDCPEVIKDDLEHYGSFSDVEIETLDVPCDELGSVCKKPFHITVMSVMK